MHHDDAARLVGESNGEVLRVVRKLGLSDEQLEGLVAEPGANTAEVVNAKCLAKLALAVEDLAENKSDKRSASKRSGSK